MIAVLWLHSKTFRNFRLQERHLRRLKQAFPDYTFIHCQTKEEFLSALPRADIASAFSFKEEWFPAAQRLRRFISPTAGREWFPPVFPPRVRCEFSIFHGKIMAETVVGMMLSHARGLMRAYNLQQKEAWPNQTLEPGLRILHGSRVTILGFGQIGTYIGRLAKNFGVKISGLKRNTGSSPDFFVEEDRLLPADCLDTVLPETDHLVICLPATKETTGLLDRRRMALLPLTAGIYNVGRGNAIDESALVDFLHQHPLCEAYLDVFREEPLAADSPLRACPNCIILPHVSANAPEYMDLFVEELIQRLEAE